MTSATDTDTKKQRRVAPGHVVDPGCETTASHGFLRSYTHNGCRCPGEGMAEFDAYRERQARQARERYAKSKATGSLPQRPLFGQDHELRFTTLPTAGHQMTAVADKVNTDERALCRDEDPELWFPAGDSGPALAQTRLAKSICAACPVEDDCLTGALQRGDDFGIFGGLTEQERRVIKQSPPAWAEAS